MLTLPQPLAHQGHAASLLRLACGGVEGVQGWSQHPTGHVPCDRLVLMSFACWRP